MSEDKGWIKLHRRILEWEWFDDPNTFRVFMYCLLKANHKDKRYRGQIIPRGSFLTGRQVMAFDTGLSERSVRTSLEHLKSTGELTIKSTNKGSHVFVVNWEKYQNGEEEPTSKSTNQQSVDRPATDQQPTTNKNDKNVKNEKNKEGGRRLSSAPFPFKGKNEEEDFINFVGKFNQAFGRGFSGSKEAFKNYKELLRLGKTLEDFKHAFAVAVEDQWAIKTGNMNPEFFTRVGRFEGYVNSYRSRNEK